VVACKYRAIIVVKLCNINYVTSVESTIGNDNLHGISNDNGVRVVNFATSKNLIVKSTMFPHHNVHKFMWTSPDVKTHNQIDHILIGRSRHSSVFDV
jgi:hypothetical protein